MTVEKAARIIGVTGFLFFVLTGLCNVSIIALDDYESSVAPIVPAQNHELKDVLAGPEFRSPLPGFTLYGIAQLALAMGVTDPLNQFRVVLAVWAGFAYLMFAYFGLRMMRDAFGRQSSLGPIFLFLVSFYAVSPLFLSRPMIESLAAPFLLASASYLVRYHGNPSLRSILLSATFLCVASLYRFQAGVCGLALLGCVLLHRHYQHAALLIFYSALLFVLTGFLDGLFKGGFHPSLLAYVKFNWEHGSTFGVTPFYTYLLLFLGLSFPPLFFSRFEGFRWRDSYRRLSPAMAYFLIFVLAHSFVPHKEERFMITIIPFFFLLLSPLAEYLLDQRWRVAYFFFLNVPLLFLASFSTVQSNTIGVAHYLEVNKPLREIVAVEQSVVLLPKAFISRPIVETTVTKEQLSAMSSLPCDAVVAARKPWVLNVPDWLVPRAEFRPGLLEAVVVRLNPRQNARRDTITLYQHRDCAKGDSL